MPMTTENSTAITMYDKVSDPLEFIQRTGEIMAKSGFAGVEKVEQGMLLAWMSLCEKKSPTEILRQYHIVKGKLSMKAEAMLAEFNNRGGKHFWVKSDQKEAILRLTYGQFKDFDVSYTIEDAERAGLCGKNGARLPKQTEDSNWQKRSEVMLRARVTSKGVHMVAPAINAGISTPEEIEDYRTIVTVQPERKSLLAPAQAPAAPQAAIEPEVMPPEAVDTPANSTAIEAEVVPPEEKEAAERKELIELLEEVGPDGAEWLVAKKWVKNAEEIEALPIQKVRDLIGRKSQFKQAVKTFKALQVQNTKK